MLDSLNKTQKIIFFIILSTMILIIIYYLYISIYKDNSSYLFEENTLLSNDTIFNNTDEFVYENSNLKINKTNYIVVYVCGAVKESKVITIKENSRICDAIDAVGGLNSDADLTNINLASIIEDGEKIYIPKKGEVLNTDSDYSFSPNSSYLNNNNSNNIKNNKININKANQTQLETIPGIGPSTALKIINYRDENGNFSSIEDIKNVSGIGEAKYEKIKNYISIK